MRAALAAGADDGLLCLSGEIHFRRANFTEAARDYEAAIALNPGQCPCVVGIGADRTGTFPRTARPRPLRQGVCAESSRHRHHSGLRRFRHRPRVQIHPSGQCGAPGGPRPAGTRRHAPSPNARFISGYRAALPSRLASPYVAYRLPLSGFRPTTSRRPASWSRRGSTAASPSACCWIPARAAS